MSFLHEAETKHLSLNTRVRALNSQDTHDLLAQGLWQLDQLICPTKIISS